MVVSRQDTGRTNQKQRTRRAIIDAAAELVRENRTPTVAEAAERALVSRATAYRYFPSQQSLLIEVQADAHQPDIDAVLARAGDDIGARVEAVIRLLTRMVLADEPLFRNQMRAIQDLWFAQQGEPSVPIREGRRLAWIDKAIAPSDRRLTTKGREQLRRALAVVIGVEPVLALLDVCGLSAQQTEDTLVWTARAVVAQAMSA